MTTHAADFFGKKIEERLMRFSELSLMEKVEKWDWWRPPY
jgi:hypothetical protein